MTSLMLVKVGVSFHLVQVYYIHPAHLVLRRSKIADIQHNIYDTLERMCAHYIKQR